MTNMQEKKKLDLLCFNVSYNKSSIKNKEKKYKGVLEIKYKLSGDFTATADHLLGVLILYTRINHGIFYLSTRLQSGPQESMHEYSLTYLL